MKYCGIIIIFYSYSPILFDLNDFTKFLFQVPKYGRLVKTYDEFVKCSTEIAHFAVHRIAKYWHHFIIANFCGEKRKRIQYTVTIRTFFTGPGQVIEDDLRLDVDIRETIKNGTLYIIDAPDYPKTKEEMKEVEKRWQDRLREKNYDLGYNNCEHLVSYILTGKAKSEQIHNASHSRMIIVDLIDCIVCHGKRNVLKIFLMLSSAALAVPIINNACSLIATSASKVFETIANQPLMVSLDIFTRKFVGFACKKANICVIDIAKSATRNALLCNAAVSFFFTALVETGFALYVIKKLKQNKNAGKINEEDYNREKWKLLGEGISATIGSVIGGLLGQAIIPIPILGYLVGSSLGNYLGRQIGTSLFGLVYGRISKNDKNS